MLSRAVADAKVLTAWESQGVGRLVLVDRQYFQSVVAVVLIKQVVQSLLKTYGQGLP